MSFVADAFATRDRSRAEAPGSARVRRLAAALALSLLGHVVLLCWPVPPPIGGGPNGAWPSPPKLRVSLNLLTESRANPVPKDSPAAQPPEDKEKDRHPPAVDQIVQDAPALLGYYPAGRLSRMPVAVSVFDIRPPAGGDTGLDGKITIRLWIGVQGGIDSARVLASDLPTAYEAAVLAAFQKMRFEPGEISGIPVRSWVDIVIQYADVRR